MRLSALYIVVYSLTILISIILAITVISRGRQKTVNALFSLYTLSFIFWIVSNFFADSFTNPATTLLWTKMGLIGPIMVAPIFLHLSFVFPIGELKRKWVILTWFLPICLILLTPTSLNIKSIEIREWGTDYQPGPLYTAFTILLLGYIGSAIYIFLRKAKHASSTVRSQIKLIILGTLFTVIVGIITGAILPLLGYSQFAILAPGSTLILFGAIAYAIIKHRFLDINLLIARSVAFVFLLVLIVFIYTLALYALSPFFPNNYKDLLSICIAVITAFTYNPLRRVIESLTKNIFYKEPYNSDELLENLGQIIRSTLSLDKLTQDVLTLLSKTLHISRAAFVIKEEKDSFIIKHSGYPQKPQFTANTIHNLTSTAKNDLIIFDELEESAAKMLLRQEQISLVLPLKVKDTSHGLLLLGEKSSGEIYSQQDIDVLEIFMPQIAIAVQNAQSYSEISHFADTLKEEVAKATTDLKSANRHLKHLDKLKNDFIFVATHELKNPVTAMRGYLSMFEEGVFGHIPAKMDDPIKQLKVSSEQLVDLVNDLLQVARSEAKTLKIFPEPVNICQLVDVVKENLKPLADIKGLKLIHDCPQGAHLMVKADPQRLKEVLNNLLSNAIKYSPKGTITVSHDLVDHLVKTNVTDQGVGISPADLKKLFTKFFRVEEEAAKGIPGTGLGLFIIKQFIEKMGGGITVESQKGKGSTFSFTLPKA